MPSITEDSIQNFETMCESVDDYYLAALETAATVAKSPAIALALLDGFLTIDQALNCSRSEENLQIEEFGKIEGAHDIDEFYERMVLSAAKNLVNLKQF